MSDLKSWRYTDCNVICELGCFMTYYLVWTFVLLQTVLIYNIGPFTFNSSLIVFLIPSFYLFITEIFHQLIPQSLKMSYVNCKSLRTFCSKCRLLEGFRLTIVNVYFCHRKSVSKVLSQNQFKPPLYDQMCIYLFSDL